MIASDQTVLFGYPLFMHMCFNLRSSLHGSLFYSVGMGAVMSQIRVRIRRFCIQLGVQNLICVDIDPGV